MRDIEGKTSEELELFHHGIKGMKWGVTRKEGSDGTVGSRHGTGDSPKGKGSAKPSKEEKKAKRAQRDDEILSARERNVERDSNINTTQAKVQQHRRAGSHRKADQLTEKLFDMEMERFASPDRQTASRLTSGERWVLGGTVAASVGISLLFGSGRR